MLPPFGNQGSAEMTDETEPQEILGANFEAIDLDLSKGQSNEDWFHWLVITWLAAKILTYDKEGLIACIQEAVESEGDDDKLEMFMKLAEDAETGKKTLEAAAEILRAAQARLVIAMSIVAGDDDPDGGLPLETPEREAA